MTYESIIYVVNDGVATITLNRPETYNALTLAAIDEVKQAFKQVAADSSVRAVVFTGNGKGFSSGADLTEISSSLMRGEPVDITELLRNGLNTLTTRMRTLEKPIICAINGVAAGAGASLALAADYRLASEKASFVFAAFVNIGLVPDAGASYLLQQLVGPAKALELVMLADSKNRVTAEDALNLGLVNALVSPDELNTRAQELALKLAKMPTKAIGLTKRAIYRASDRSWSDSLDYEALTQGVAFKTHDFKEGVAAFIEKREPHFKGE